MSALLAWQETSMKRFWILSLFGFGCYIVFLIVLWPATWLVPRQGRSGLDFMGVSGTIWSGQVQSLVWRGFPLGQVHWRFAPTALLRGQLGAWIELRGADVLLHGVGTGNVIGHGVELRDVAIQRLAPELAQRLGLPWRLTGSIRGHVDFARWQPGAAPELTGTWLWSQAAVLSPVAIRLGKVQIRAISIGPREDIEATFQGGDLTGTGSLMLGPGQHYVFKLNIEAANVGVRSMLRSLGQSDATGHWVFKKRGDLRGLGAWLGI